MTRWGVPVVLTAVLVVAMVANALAVGAVTAAPRDEGDRSGGCEPPVEVDRTHDGAVDWPTEDGKRYVVAPNRSRFAVLSRDARGNLTSHVWGNETTVFSKGDADLLPRRPTLYTATPVDDLEYVAVPDLVHRGVDAVETDLRNADFNVTDVIRRDGRRSFVLRSGRISYELGKGENWSRWEYNATLVVDSAGRIRYFHAYRHATAPDDDRTFREEYRLCQLGGVVASPPAWVADVPPEAHLNVRLFPRDENQRYLVLTNEGTDPVPSNGVLAIRRGDTTYRLTLDEPLAPGETLYAYFADGGFYLTERESVARQEGECLGAYVQLEAFTETGAFLSGGGGTTQQCESPENETPGD